MDEPALKGLSVFQRLADAVGNSASRPDRSEMPYSPASMSPGGGVKHDESELFVTARPGQLLGRMVVGKLAFDGLEAQSAGGGEAVQHRYFLKHPT
jgi:hypothetical protein